MDKSQNKTNIVLLTDCLGDITGGAEKQIFEVAYRLPKDLYEVHIASMEAQGETSKAMVESIGCRLQIFRVKRIYGLSGLIQGLRFLFFLRKHSIHTVMTYHFGSDIWGTFWAHLAGVPLILSNRRDMGFWRQKRHVQAYRKINGWVNSIIVVASCIKDMVLDTEGVKPEKVKVIINGVELPQNDVDPLKKRAELGLNPLDMVIMHVANLRPVKGHKYLIEAFAGVEKRFAGIRLVLIGKDELNGELQSLAKSLNVQDKVLFLGQRLDVDELLAVSDICVLPSLSEGLSNAILEYMSHGKPVIATRVGGNPEIIQHGYNGLLVDKANAQQLAAALLELIESEHQRTTLGTNGLNMIQYHFSIQAMMNNYQKVLS
jgi:glycosyltransferase involved in cell wall biosynthesis